MPAVFSIAAVVCGAPRLWSAAPRAQGHDLLLPQAGEEPGSPYSWAPELLYGIISSKNPRALNALYDAAFAAGPALVPELEAALPDDRTAEFAAQSLAFIGGKPAIDALARLVHDPRDLDLRQFYYGALGGLDDPEHTGILLQVIRNANSERDRAVTDAAIIALTVRSDPSLVGPLQQAEARLTDPVIQDDLANAIAIIQNRARYLVSHPGPSAPKSIAQAVRLYFIPAIEPPPGRNTAPRIPGERSGRAPATFEIRHVEYSPGQSRAMARVTFEDPEATALYWLVLEKQAGSWAIVSAWLEAEQAKTAGAP